MIRNYVYSLSMSDIDLARDKRMCVKSAFLGAAYAAKVILCD